jgi:hypothetical protein
MVHHRGWGKACIATIAGTTNFGQFRRKVSLFAIFSPVHQAISLHGTRILPRRRVLLL